MERLNEGKCLSCVAASEAQCLQRVSQEGNTKSSKTKEKLMVSLDFGKKKKDINTVFLMKLNT